MECKECCSVVGFDSVWYVVGPFERAKAEDNLLPLIAIDKIPNANIKVDGKDYAVQKQESVDGVLSFGQPDMGREAYVFQTVKSDAQQMMIVGAEASKEMQLWCNGDKIFSNVVAGLGRGEAVLNYVHNIFQVPLKKGENIIAVRACGGKLSFKLAIRAKGDFPSYIQNIVDKPQFPAVREIEAMRVAPFIVDITPPIDFPMITGVNKKVDTPIYVRGAVVDDGKNLAVLAAIDICYLGGKECKQWDEAIGKAAGIPAEQVFFHAVHQHDSLYFDSALDEVSREFLKSTSTPPAEFADQMLEKTCATIKEAIDSKTGSWQNISSVATAETRIMGAGSYRRLMGDNGKVAMMRFSMAPEHIHHITPTGPIDPLLRTIAFLDKNNKVVIAAHYYASHPMAAYGRNMVSSDVPGVAIAYALANGDKNTHHIYFNGCGGDIAFGRHTVASREENLKAIGERLGQGILKNIAHLDKKPMGELVFGHASFEFKLHQKMHKIDLLAKNKEAALYDPYWEQYWHASYYSIVKEWEKWQNCQLSRLSIGRRIHILAMPSESCVEYQLYAQSLVPEEFVACAAYGRSYYIYIPTTKMLSEEGYEGGWGSISGPENEQSYKDAIFELMNPLR